MYNDGEWWTACNDFIQQLIITKKESKKERKVWRLNWGKDTRDCWQLKWFHSVFCLPWFQVNTYISMMWFVSNFVMFQFSLSLVTSRSHNFLSTLVHGFLYHRSILVCTMVESSGYPWDDFIQLVIPNQEMQRINKLQGLNYGRKNGKWLHSFLLLTFILSSDLLNTKISK
jgi:hypothetical protein